jgi:hypothetical protein
MSTRNKSAYVVSHNIKYGSGLTSSTLIPEYLFSDEVDIISFLCDCGASLAQLEQRDRYFTSGIM